MKGSTKKRRISAEGLIDLAITTLRRDVTPGLDADKRYQLAMVARALEIAKREVQIDGEQARFTLLDAVYDDGEGTLEQLAVDIRSGHVSPRSHPDLEDQLRRLLLEELAIRNPKALKAAQSAT